MGRVGEIQKGCRSPQVKHLMASAPPHLMLRSPRNCPGTHWCPPQPARKSGVKGTALSRNEGDRQFCLGTGGSSEGEASCSGEQQRRNLKELAKSYKRKLCPGEQEMPQQTEAGGQDMVTLGSASTSAAHGAGCAEHAVLRPEHYLQPGFPAEEAGPSPLPGQL